MYKPGQLITINNKVYRIKKAAYGCITCDYIHIDVKKGKPCKKCPVVIEQTRRIKLVELCGKKAKKLN